MELVETTTFSKEVEVGVVKVKKTENGISLFVRSPIIHAFFKNLADPADPVVAVTRWGIEIYKTTFTPTFKEFDLGKPGEPLIFNEYLVNLSFLKAVDLAEGVTIKQTGVFVNSYCANLKMGVARGMQEIYCEYLRPFDSEVQLTSRTKVEAA